MPVDFSVKRVPDAVARKLRERAARHHRSLQQELLCILETAAADVQSTATIAEPAPPTHVPKPATRAGEKTGSRLTLEELWARARKLGGPVQGESSAALIRADRDARGRR